MASGLPGTTGHLNTPPHSATAEVRDMKEKTLSIANAIKAWDEADPAGVRWPTLGHWADTFGVGLRVPNWILMSPLTDGAVQLYTAMAPRIAGLGGGRFTRRDLASMAGGRTAKVARGYAAELEDFGALHVEVRVVPRVGQEANWYRIIVDGPTTRDAGRTRPPARVRILKTGWVYFVQCGDRVKIGQTGDLDGRLKGLRSSSGSEIRELLTIPSNDVVGLERAFHRRFSHLREHGEWFRHEGHLSDWLRRQGEVLD